MWPRNRIFFVLIFLGANLIIAQQPKSKVEISPPMLSAQNSVDFVNSLNGGLGSSNVIFSCQFKQGTREQEIYRVLYSTPRQDFNFNRPRFHSNPKILEHWDFRAFSDIESSLAFVNEKGLWAQFISCFNPNKIPESSFVMVFYLKEENLSDADYVLAEKSFSSAEAAAGHANANHYSEPQFISEFVVSKQLRSSWRIIIPKGDKNRNKDFSWRVFRGDLEQISGLLSDGTIGSPHVISEYDLVHANSATVLFYKKINDKGDDYSGHASNFFREPLISLRTQVFATKALLDNPGEIILSAIVKDAIESLKYQTSSLIDLKVEPGIRLIAGEPDHSIGFVGRPPDTLEIIFTDKPLRVPAGGLYTSPSGFAGRGWVAVWVISNADYGHTPQHILLHEILHEFGVRHRADQFSVMCTIQDSDLEACSGKEMNIDSNSFRSLRGGVRAIKEIGFDTYVGIVSRASR